AAMADYLAREKLRPDLVLCSAARRTVETWRRMAGRLGGKARVLFEPALYLAEPEALLGRLRAAPDDAETVMLLGHNPALEMLARRLAHGGDREARRRMTRKFPTGAVAIVALDVARWSDLAERKGRLDR